jgi:cytoskeleton protein RodZ
MSLEQIGLKLKAARETQGLSLRQIHDRTKIPIGHLQALDGGMCDDLPEPVYVAGFIKRYGDCVGLNGQSLSEEYRRAADSNGDNGKATWGKNAGVPEAVIVTPEYYRSNKLDSGTPTFKTMYFNAIWIVVVIGLVSYLGMTQLNNQANQQDPSVLSLQQSAALHNANNLPTTNPSGAPMVMPNDHVTLNATQHVWVEVKSASNGQSLFTGYMESGDRKEFKDPQGLRIRAGNGASLNVDYQGKVEPFGQAAQVAERVFDTKPSADATTTTATTTDSTTSTTASTPAATRPVSSTVAPRRVRTAPTRITAARDTTYRRIDDAPSRQYIPGEGLGGGTRSIDVPYRYTEGRLDAD